MGRKRQLFIELLVIGGTSEASMICFEFQGSLGSFIRNSPWAHSHCVVNVEACCCGRESMNKWSEIRRQTEGLENAIEDIYCVKAAGISAPPKFQHVLYVYIVKFTLSTAINRSDSWGLNMSFFCCQIPIS